MAMKLGHKLPLGQLDQGLRQSLEVIADAFQSIFLNLCARCSLGVSQFR